MPDSPTILLVDDEDVRSEAADLPARARRVPGHPRAGRRGGAGAFAEEDVDLVVLDLMLPKLDGLEVCKRLRAHSTVPIIMLTARDDELDKVLGLELGADDYITKPFSIREFRSRVRALLRRARAPARRAGGRRGDRGGRAEDRRRPAHGRGARPAGRSSPTSSSSCCGRSPSQPGRVFSRRMLLEGLWGGADTASRARSTSTCAICARSSSATRAPRS